MRSAILLGLTCVGIVTVDSAFANAAEPAVMKLMAPLPYQVVQREGWIPERAGPHEPGGPVRGDAAVPVSGTSTDNPQAAFLFRAVPLWDAFGQGVDWTEFRPKREGRSFSGQVTVPAGGWYRLEVRADVDGKTVSASTVEPFGVGEIFVVAGQSYAEGANDELLSVEDPQGRVVAFDNILGKWRVAKDPQPNRGTGGTIWPPMGNALLPIAQVPIAFVNVASGGTSSRQWLPGEPLYNNLEAAGKTIGRFRAVLWQQGESDVIENVSTETYVKNLTLIRLKLAESWRFSPPWLAAKSTLHPTVYNRPVEEGRIRAAIDQLWKTEGFRPGPDTDILDGENRGGVGTRRHFSGIGQRRAGLMWFAATWSELNRSPSK
ncbi:MAG: sialate O-acetylesterase [Planctomycetaceae bacterium]